MCIRDRKKGAQKESRLSKPDAGEFLALWNRYPGLIKIVDLAPELEGAEDFIRRVRSRCVISMAHTAASYEGALEAFRQGVGPVSYTHLEFLQQRHTGRGRGGL